MYFIPKHEEKKRERKTKKKILKKEKNERNAQFQFKYLSFLFELKLGSFNNISNKKKRNVDECLSYVNFIINPITSGAFTLFVYIKDLC